MKKKAFLNLNGFSEEFFLNEDHDLVGRAYKAGFGVKMLTDTGIRFSFRRMQKEGKMKFIKEIIASRFHYMSNKNPSEKIYAYEMGGKHYDK